jgi:hypothetical protein
MHDRNKIEMHINKRMKKGYSNLQRCSRRLLPTTAKLESKGHEV